MVAEGHAVDDTRATTASFATTHWSVVLAAGQTAGAPASAALERLCRTYWPPLYAHVRARGRDPAAAQDLTQEFFARLLAKHWLAKVVVHRGRFRSFLLASFDHFLANEWDRAGRQKRGGGLLPVPFDTAAAEQCYAEVADSGLNPMEVYEQNWALQLLEEVRARLRQEYATARKTARFELLESFLPGEEQSLT